MFFSKIRKIICITVNPIYYIKVGFKGSKLYRHIFVVQRSVKSACLSKKSKQSLRCPHEETLHSELSKKRPVKIPTRLRTCDDWFESLLAAHVLWYVFWRCCSNFYASMIFLPIATSCLSTFVLCCRCVTQVFETIVSVHRRLFSLVSRIFIRVYCFIRSRAGLWCII